MPEVSVILPVYNAEKFLKEAVDSILNQTFSDFELLLINDGSTDASEAIIQSYNDDRIVYIKNETNRGLIYSLNRCIDIARGHYIARMDADDISLPERLEKQVSFLSKNIHIGVLASTIDYIDDNNRYAGLWRLDRKTLTLTAIRTSMTKTCCIAHPSLIIRSMLLKKYKYNIDQQYIEDYDLWLRLLNASIKIAKIPEPLLLYRVHSNSVTISANQKLAARKRIFICKRKDLSSALRNSNYSFFNLKILLSMFTDLMIITKKKFLPNPTF